MPAAALAVVGVASAVGSAYSSHKQASTAQRINQSQVDAANRAAALAAEQQNKDRDLQRQQLDYQNALYKQQLDAEQQNQLPNILLQYFLAQKGLKLPGLGSTSTVPDLGGSSSRSIGSGGPTVGGAPRSAPVPMGGNTFGANTFGNNALSNMISPTQSLGPMGSVQNYLGLLDTYKGLNTQIASNALAKNPLGTIWGGGI